MIIFIRFFFLEQKSKYKHLNPTKSIIIKPLKFADVSSCNEKNHEKSFREKYSYINFTIRAHAILPNAAYVSSHWKAQVLEFEMEIELSIQSYNRESHHYSRITNQE